jgi:serine/threonine-protein kinase HipA
MTIEVHIDWLGKTYFVGRLYKSGRKETVSFEYDSEWLNNPNSFAIDPIALPRQPGAHHGGELFGAIQDCGPDRWGRMLIERAVHKRVLPQRPYHDMDYVLALDDSSRIGSLRFRTEPEGPFLAPSDGKLPPMVRLPALLDAANAVQGKTETAKDLRYLLGAGSPIGGARPKSAVRLNDGSLAIAKFPKQDDIRDIAAGEILALTIAQHAGIRVAGNQLVNVQGNSVSVITRFDRKGDRRIPFLSANSLLGLKGEPGSYTQMADCIRQYGHNISADLRELWRRLIFSLLASNYDDHPRNHGFLMEEPERWGLSPAYDLNPVPEIDRSSMPKTPISEDSDETSISEALKAISRFGLKRAEAGHILREVFDAVRNWRRTARSLRIKAATIDAYTSALENPLMEEARQLLKG